MAQEKDDTLLDLGSTAGATEDRPAFSGLFKGKVTAATGFVSADGETRADKITVEVTEGPQAGTSADVMLFHGKPTHKDGGKYANSLLVGAYQRLGVTAKEHLKKRAEAIGKVAYIEYTTAEDRGQKYGDAKLLTEAMYTQRLAYQAATNEGPLKPVTRGARADGQAASDDDIPF